MWQRYNTATKIFELSSDKGQIWTPMELDASVISQGIFGAARIPDLDAAKIVSGAFDAARIPNLDASKITTGAFDKARQHAQTAYKDEANVFTLGQSIGGAGIRLTDIDPADGILANGAINSNLRLRANGSMILNVDDNADGAGEGIYFRSRGSDLVSVIQGEGGFRFPATQLASANANHLDDCERGTWSPVIGGLSGESGQSYGAQIGTYQKVGSWVSLWCYVAFTAKGTITGALVLKGLPFVVASSPSQYSPLVCSYWSSMGTSWYSIGGYTHHGANFAYIQGANAAVSGIVGLTTTDVGNGSGMMFRVSYRAAN